MRATIVIPLWSGAADIGPCLEQVRKHSGDLVSEVVCVDNASPDDAAEIVGRDFPEVRLLRQPTNLGFAGGVNQGIAVSSSDVVVLLNQDCRVHSGWLEALVGALEAEPEAGIAGATLLDREGSVEHAGASLDYPLAYGVHRSEPFEGVRPAEFVTGAVFALRRSAWLSVGWFDQGFYPAYYEDCDYCLRARHRGFGTICVGASRAVHRRDSVEWRQDPPGHAANHHFVRYRFVAKHYDEAALSDFFAAEEGAVRDEQWFDQLFGRIVAVRRLFRRLDQVAERRRAHLGGDTSSARSRQLANGLRSLARSAFALARDWLDRVPPAPDEDDDPASKERKELRHRTLLLERILEYDF